MALQTNNKNWLHSHILNTDSLKSFLVDRGVIRAAGYDSELRVGDIIDYDYAVSGTSKVFFGLAERRNCTRHGVMLRILRLAGDIGVGEIVVHKYGVREIYGKSGEESDREWVPAPASSEIEFNVSDITNRSLHAGETDENVILFFAKKLICDALHKKFYGFSHDYSDMSEFFGTKLVIPKYREVSEDAQLGIAELFFDTLVKKNCYEKHGRFKLRKDYTKTVASKSLVCVNKPTSPARAVEVYTPQHFTSNDDSFRVNSVAKAKLLLKQNCI